MLHDFRGHGGEGHWSVVTRVLFFTPFKNGCAIPISLVTRVFAWLLWLFKYDGEWLGNYIIQFPQDPGMYLIGSHGLVYIQVPQVVLNLIFSYSWRDLISPVPALRFRDLREVGGEITIENWGKKTVEYLSLLHVSCQQLSCHLLWGCIFIELPFLANILVEALIIILCIPCQTEFQMCLSFPDPTFRKFGITWDIKPLNLTSIPRQYDSVPRESTMSPCSKGG